MSETETGLLYQAVCAEINRLRDEQWRISYYFISVSLGMIYFFSSTSTDKELIDNCAIRVICVFVQFAAVIMFIHHILTTHRYLTMHRVMRRKIEGRLGVQNLTDTDGETILPIGWQGNAVDKFFEFNTVIVPLSMFVLLLQGLSIWQAWPK